MGLNIWSHDSRLFDLMPCPNEITPNVSDKLVKISDWLKNSNRVARGLEMLGLSSHFYEIFLMIGKKWTIN